MAFESEHWQSAAVGGDGDGGDGDGGDGDGGGGDGGGGDGGDGEGGGNGDGDGQNQGSFTHTKKRSFCQGGNVVMVRGVSHWVTLSSTLSSWLPSPYLRQKEVDQLPKLTRAYSLNLRENSALTCR